MRPAVEAMVLVRVCVQVQPPLAVAAKRAVDMYLPQAAILHWQPAFAGRHQDGKGFVCHASSPCLFLRHLYSIHLQRLPRNDPRKDRLAAVLRGAEVAVGLRVVYEQRIALAGKSR